MSGNSDQEPGPSKRSTRQTTSVSSPENWVPLKDPYREQRKKQKQQQESAQAQQSHTENLESVHTDTTHTENLETDQTDPTHTENLEFTQYATHTENPESTKAAATHTTETQTSTLTGFIKSFWFKQEPTEGVVKTEVHSREASVSPDKEIYQTPQTSPHTSPHRVPTPPPRPPSPPIFYHSANSTTASSTSMTTAQKQNHVDLHNALHARITSIKDAIKDHHTGTTLMTQTEAEAYLDDINSIKVDMSNQQKNSFRYYDNAIDPASGVNPQVAAVNTYEALEKIYRDIRIQMMDLSKSLNTATTASKLKIPKFSVPTFSGQHAEWPTFKSSFTTLVSNSTAFSSSEKFRLLVDALAGGEAKINLTDLKIVDGSWDIGWKRLLARYDSPREIIHAAIRPLLELPPLMSQSSEGIHRLICTVRTTKAQINETPHGAVSEADILYSHFLMARLDTKTIQEFNQSLPGNDVPNLDTLLNFLEKQAKNLSLTKEIKNNATVAGPHLQRKDKNHHQRSERRVMIASTDGETTDHSESGDSSKASKKKYRKSKKKNEANKAVNVNTKQSNESKPRDKSPDRKSQPWVPPARETGTTERRRYPCGVCQSQQHRLMDCPTFMELSPQKRYECIAHLKRCFNCFNPHRVAECQSKYTCSICHKKHHTLLHMENNAPKVNHILNPVNKIKGKEGTGLLPTAIVKCKFQRQSHIARCLLDSGAQDAFITRDLATKMKLPITNKSQNFTVAGNSKLTTHGKTVVQLQSMYDPSKVVDISAYILEEITSDVPGETFEIDDWAHLEGLQLADPNFNQPGPIDILLGTAIVDEVTTGKKIKGRPGTPSAHATEFGYVVYGPLLMESSDNIFMINDSEPLPFDMERFWAVEEMPAKKILTPLEQFCEDHYAKTTERLPNGQYQIRWPVQGDFSMLGESMDIAIRRWKSTERTLLRNTTTLQKYHDQLQQYLDNDQMELVPEDEIYTKSHYYMPHHAVVKPSSTTTDVRVVFDASAKTSNGISLNSVLAPGPTIQPQLFDQLLKFRLMNVAMIADIEKMYRKILVHPDERDYARIVWRKNPNEPLKHYRLKCVPFGFSPAPFIACRTLLQLANDEAGNYPLGADIIRTNFYVDDFMSSHANLEEAMAIKNELITMLSTAHFNLRKWSSNSPELLASLSPELVETQITNIEENASVKTLGLQWHPGHDEFKFQVHLGNDEIITKRTILSDISKVFDPLGFLSPIIIKAKILMQAIWVEQVGWDDPLPQRILDTWHKYAGELTQMENLRIPRCLQYREDWSWQLHGFSDASESAYAAAIYLRGNFNNQVITRLVVSKSKVAPLKVLTIPRLELLGAALLAKLANHVKKLWNIEFESMHYWTDSTIVLNWIQSSPSRWKIFVANRVNEIQENSAKSQWHHVRSEDNPADCASRGLNPCELKDHPLWWKGPAWLSDQEYQIEEFTPSSQPSEEDLKEEKKLSPVICNVQQSTDTVLQALSNLSSWKKAVQVMTLIDRIRTNKSFRGASLGIKSPSELRRSENIIASKIQRQHFPFLFDENDTQSTYKERRRYRSLGIFQDDQGILRVGGRMQNADIPYHSKHPILLCGTHPLIKILIMEAHVKLAHAGKQTIANYLRQKYWIPSSTKTIKSVIDKCLICFRYTAQPMSQLMGQLPAARVNSTCPFLHTGVDYAGPYHLSNFTGRRDSKFKTYICLFTCMSTRAIHLEPVSSLSHEGFLLAFRRFISRRGKPSDIYSDNGLNFVGANNVLTETAEELQALVERSESILPGTDLNKIHWHFNPPQAPSQGGVWEACVKLVKHHLRRIMDEDTYNWEEFQTLLTITEAIVNSRPLTPLSEDPHDLEVLTPAHFLIGTSLTTTPEHDLSHLNMNRLSKFQLIQRRSQELWKRWQEEYITLLQKRGKWQNTEENLKVGDMVLIMDDQLPPLIWKIGRITKVHPGKDGLVRASTIEFDGTYKKKKKKLVKISKECLRPITKLAKLPIERDTPTSTPIVAQVRKSTSISPWNWINTMTCLTLLALAAPSTAQHNRNPNLATIAPSCEFAWNTHHEIPICTSQADWIHILNDGTVCSRSQQCTNQLQLTADARSCRSSSSECDSLSQINLDHLECQNHDKPFNKTILEHSDIKSTFCAIGDYTLKNCLHFIEIFADVPVVTYGTKVYPVSSLNLQQESKKHLSQSHNCTGRRCEELNCGEGQCRGDKEFCEAFECSNDIRHECYCTYDDTAVLHKIVTNQGETYPHCWGHLYLLIRKEDLTLTRDQYKSLIITKGQQHALTTCNHRQEVVLNRLGEIQCDSREAAQTLNGSCFASIDLVRTITDSEGVKCISNLQDPEELMKINPLPMKLGNGILVPNEESIIFETSINTMLEIQMSTGQLEISKLVQETSCFAEVIKLQGCYSCLGGATLLLQAKVESGETLGTLECMDIGFFSPIHLTEQLKTYHIIMKLDSPDINLECSFKCSRSKLQLKIIGHLHYLSNEDSRNEHVSISYEPPQSQFGGFGFNIFSILGSDLTSWLIRGLAAMGILIFTIMIILTTLKLMMKKIL